MLSKVQVKQTGLLVMWFLTGSTRARDQPDPATARPLKPSPVNTSLNERIGEVTDGVQNDCHFAGRRSQCPQLVTSRKAVRCDEAGTMGPKEALLVCRPNWRV